MESINVCDLNSSNKENISPLSVNQATPFLANVPPAKKTFKRRVRRPLDDITHLFKNSAVSSLGEGNCSIATLAPSVSVCVSNSRKRKTFEEAEEQSSRSLRIGLIVYMRCQINIDLFFSSQHIYLGLFCIVGIKEDFHMGFDWKGLILIN